MFNPENKKARSEEDIKRLHITPALESKWDKTHIQMERFFTDGQIVVDGSKAKRRESKKADYILYYPQTNTYRPLAVVEAKDSKKTFEGGIQQAIEYAKMLDVPFAYSSNGDAFLEHDFTTGQERTIRLDEFPTAQELWNRYKGVITPAQEKIITTPYHSDYDVHEPRYYQRIAINRTVEAVANGQERVMLVMATGTGKTYIAMQIIHRLRTVGLKKKILFIADRNILIDQTMNDDFKPFKKIMTKIKDCDLDTSYEVYMSLYHQLAGQEEDEGNEPFRQVTPDFFDLIVVDECHRGSAKEASRWRAILDYFSSATQVGMTATPKETSDISNMDYFGEPVYTYSLKQGIDDGFLAPYKVIRVGLDKDLEGWRPLKGQVDDFGNTIEDREYNVKDFDRNLVLDKRTEVVAKRVTEYLKVTNRMDKTIIFCADEDHAAGADAFGDCERERRHDEAELRLCCSHYRHGRLW